MPMNYGYKVCYRERDSKVYVRYFKTYTFNQALKVMRRYIRYPPLERETGRKLNRPTWFVIPISRKEMLNGIWRECPF